MEGSSRIRGLLLAIVSVVAALYGCGQALKPPSLPDAPLNIQGADPIPAPPFAFGDSATPSQYLAYASTLSFAVEDSASAITRHGTAPTVSVVRMSPERRLVNTPESAYLVGRIIARIQTEGAVSPFNTPVGESYIWVWGDAGSVQARIITREPGLAAGGRVLTLPSFYHVPLPDTLRRGTFCIALDTIAPGNCCRCSTGCWDPWALTVPADSVRAMVRRVLGA